MRGLAILCCILVVNLLFFQADPYTPKDWWPLFDKYQLTGQFYFHRLGYQLALSAVCFAYAFESRKFRDEKLIFALMTVVDVIDFMVTNNTAWLSFLGLEVTWNKIWIVWFGIMTYKAWKRGV